MSGAAETCAAADSPVADRPEAKTCVKEALRDLTPVQRRYVLKGCISGDFSVRTVSALKAKGLFHLNITSPNGCAGFMELTPLGDAVRALLLDRAAKCSSHGGPAHG